MTETNTIVIQSTWKNYAIVLLLGGIIFLVLKGCGTNSLPPIPAFTSPKIIISQVDVREKQSQKTVDSLNSIAAALQQRNSTQASQIAQLRKDGKIMEQVINSIPAGQEEPVVQYIKNCNERDSLCDLQAANYSEQLANKDLVISEKDALYSNTRIALDTLATQQERLIDYTKDLRKQAKKIKAGNIVWKIAAIAGAVFIVKQQLK